MGVFKKVGPWIYKLKHPFWIIDASGNLGGTGVFLEQVTLVLRDLRLARAREAGRRIWQDVPA